jgi:hypothetical protein
MAVMAASTIVFGSLHLLAWDYAFTTVSEWCLWRTAALIEVYLLLLLLAINGAMATLDLLQRRDARRFLSTLHSTFKEFLDSPAQHCSSPNSGVLVMKLED